MLHSNKPSTTITMEVVKTHDHSFPNSARRLLQPCDGLARLLGLLFTLVAAVVVGVDNETKIISISLIKNMPPLHLRASAKWQYMSAFQYFVASNGIACSYAAISLIFCLITRGHKNNTRRSLLLIILDLIVMALLFSADAAAAAIGVIGRDGNSHMKWMRICGFFEGYCHHFTASIVISVAGSFMFLWLVVLSIMNLHIN